MEFLKNLRWICRLCAVNMKEKCPGLASVHIFGPAGINYKLKKYFDIEVCREDVLPKNICNLCYKKLEDVHFLARLALKTDRFLRAFVKSAIYTGQGDSSADFSAKFQSEFESFALSMNEKKSKKHLNKLENDRPSLIIKPKDTNEKTSKRKIEKDTRLMLKSMPSSTIVTSTPIPVRNNLEQKRQNLKAALATSKTTQTMPRIKVKSEMDLKAPQFNTSCNVQQDQISQPPPGTILQNQHAMKVLTVPQVPTRTTNVQSPLNDARLKLGQVVKDIDLLTLILKALKWPYTNDNILLQIERLKEAPFNEVIRNQNLLQDTDLMQILNTILSPILFQIPMVTQPQPIIPSFVSYKIPADLSVHLITEEVPNAPTAMKASKLKTIKPKPSRTKTSTKSSTVRCSSPIEILSDDESVQMFEVNVDPNLFFNADSESQDNMKSNEVLKKGKKSDEMLVFKLQTRNRKRNSSKRKSDVSLEAPPKESELIAPNAPVTVAEIQTEPTEGTSKKTTKEAEPLPPESLQSHVLYETITGDISGDDDVWADFKVIESPDTSAVEAEKTVHISCVKAEPQLAKEELRKETSTTNSETDNNSATNSAETINVKTETSTDEIDKLQPKRRRRAKNNKKQNGNAKESLEESGEPETKKVCPDNSENKKSGRNSITPSKPKPTQSNKRATRSITASQPQMSLRNSNLRRRICKQCGQSFNLLAEFLDHRKTHIYRA